MAQLTQPSGSVVQIHGSVCLNPMSSYVHMLAYMYVGLGLHLKVRAYHQLLNLSACTKLKMLTCNVHLSCDLHILNQGRGGLLICLY